MAVTVYCYRPIISINIDMKSKIILTGTLMALTFILSGYQYATHNQQYVRITKVAAPNSNAVTHAFNSNSVACAKCHDCQSYISDVPEIAVISNNRSFVFGNVKSETHSKNKIEPVLMDAPLDWYDDLNPDALKIK